MYITANYWCSSKECSMASIVRTIIPKHQNTNIKKIHFIKIISTNCFSCKAHEDIVKINFYVSDQNSHLGKITLPKVWV